MTFYLVNSIKKRAVSHRFFSFAQVLDQALGLWIKVLRELDFMFDYHFKHFLRVIGAVWRTAINQLVDENSKSIPVSSLPIP